MTQETVEYHGQKEFNEDRPKREKNGWRVVSVSQVSQPPGIKRIAALGGVGALVVKPKPYIFVVYERDDGVAQAGGGDARTQAQDARNKLVDLQGRLRSAEGQSQYPWSNIEKHIDRLANSDDLGSEDVERDFMENLDKFLDAARSANNQRQQVLAALATAQKAYSIRPGRGSTNYTARYCRRNR